MWELQRASILYKLFTRYSHHAQGCVCIVVYYCSRVCIREAITHYNMCLSLAPGLCTDYLYDAYTFTHVMRIWYNVEFV